VERRRPELAGQGGGVRRVAMASAVVPPRGGPNERADAHREARHAGPGAPSHSKRATAGRLPHRRRPPRRVRRCHRAALLALLVGPPHRREPPVADRAGGPAPSRGERRRRDGRILLPASPWHDPREPRSVLPLPVTANLHFRSVHVVLGLVPEERGERGEPAAAGPPLDLEPDVALLEAGHTSIGRFHLRRPEEEAARRLPAPRPRRRVGLPRAHVRRDRPREERDRLRRRRRRRRGRQRGRLVLRGGEREQAVADAGRAHARPALVRVPLAPHGPHLLYAIGAFSIATRLLGTVVWWLGKWEEAGRGRREFL
jgi:hypothetical protein